MMITSIQNKQVKQWRKLQTKKERNKTRMFLVEGYHLIEEAMNSGWDIQEIIMLQGVNLPEHYKGLSVVVVSENVFRHIAQTQTPQGIIAVIKMNEIAAFTGDHILLIDAVQDPGNLGTIIRTAEAAGFSAVILGLGTVDLYNDKVIRATQGALFHIPIIQSNILDKILDLKQDGFSIWATALIDATVYNKIPINDRIALIVGNEGAGIQEKILQEADSLAYIPIYGKAESLNVSVAAGILMYYLKG